MTAHTAPRVEIVLPAHNEERRLEPGVRRLVGFLRAGFPFATRITIAENGSTDRTWQVAVALAAEFAEVRAVRLDRPGKGRAIRTCWLSSDAEVLAFTDVDLSIGLNALLPLVAALLSGHSDVAIGSRLARGARQSRSTKREVLSRGYNMLLHAVLGVGFTDAQCGFKAIRADKARLLLPRTQDTGWFFDTELLVLAERSGLRVHEVPVDCLDDPDSSVDLLPTAISHLWGVARLGWGIARGAVPVPGRGGVASGWRASRGLPAQLLLFAVVGVASTGAYAAIYLVLRGMLSAQAANAITMFVTAIANTAANRRFTFGVRGRARAARHQIQGLIAFGAGLAFTSTALAALHAADQRPAHLTEVIAALAAGLLATVVKFALFRTWIFRPRVTPPETTGAAETGMAVAMSSGPTGTR